MINFNKKNRKLFRLFLKNSWPIFFLIFSIESFGQLPTEDSSLVASKEQLVLKYQEVQNFVSTDMKKGIALFRKYEKAFSFYPGLYANTMFIVAKGYGQLKQYEKANALLDNCLSITSDSTLYSNMLYHKGTFLYSENKFSAAISVLDQCKTYYQDKEDVLLKKVNNFLAHAYFKLGFSYQASNKDSFLYYLFEAEKIVCSPNLSKDTLKVNVLYTLGANFARSYDTLKAFKYFDRATQIEVGFAEVVLQNIAFEKGLIYGKLGMFKAAMKHHKSSLAIATKNENNYSIYANISSIGHLFFDITENEKALIYYQQGYDFAKKINNTYLLSNALSNLGNTHLKTKDYDAALTYYQQAQIVNDSLDNKLDVLKTNLQIAQVKYEQGLIKEAYQYNTKAYDMAKKLGFKEQLANSAALFSAIAIQQKDYNLSIKKSAEVIALKAYISKLELVDVYKHLTTAHEAIGNYKMALKHHKLLKVTTDSFFNVEKTKAFATMEAKFQNEKISTENQYLKKEEVRKETIIQQRTWLAIAIGISLLLSSVLAWIFAQKNKQKQLINQLLSREVKAKNVKIEQKNTQLEGLNENAKSLEKLVAEKDYNIVTKTATLNKYNKQLEQVEVDLSKLMQDASINNKKALHHLKRKLQAIQIKENNHLQEFNLSLINHDPIFFQKLVHQYPNLTQNELNHSAFIRLNMTMKEVADLMNITEDSVKKARYRLKKKIGLTVKVDLKKHLLGM